MPNYDGGSYDSSNPNGNDTTSSATNGWTTRDTLGTTLDVLGLWQNSQLSEDQAAAMQQGMAVQNPFNPYRQGFANELMGLQQNPGNIVNTPGYQFAYDQGLQSLFAKQGATGNRFSGQAMTESQQFGQGLASQMYNSEMDRLMQLSGASFSPSGGVQTAQNLSSIYSQDQFNQMQGYQSLIDRFYPQQPTQYQPTPWTPSGYNDGR